MDMQSILNSILSSGQADKISQKTGLSQDQLSQVIAAGLPMILGGMANNASSKNGAESLNNALDKHTNSPVLDDAEKAASDTAESEGGSILGHVFGDNKSAAADGVAKQTGVDSATVMKVMAMLAPLVMAYLAKQKSTSGFDARSLANILSGFLGGNSQQQTAGSSILDSVIGMFSKK